MGFMPTGGVPRIFIGPTWQFAIPVVGLVILLAYLVISILYFMDRTSMILRVIGLMLAMLGLYFYAVTLLGDPGIPKDLKDFYFNGG